MPALPLQPLGARKPPVKPLHPQDARCDHDITEVLQDQFGQPFSRRGFQVRWCKVCEKTWWEPVDGA